MAVGGGSQGHGELGVVWEIESKTQKQGQVRDVDSTSKGLVFQGSPRRATLPRTHFRINTAQFVFLFCTLVGS